MYYWNGWETVDIVARCANGFVFVKTEIGSVHLVNEFELTEIGSP